MRRNAPYVWSGFALLLIGISAAANFGTWRRSAAPRSARTTRRGCGWSPRLRCLRLRWCSPWAAHDFREQRGRIRRGLRELAAPWLLRTVALNWLVLLAVGCVFALSPRGPRGCMRPRSSRSGCCCGARAIFGMPTTVCSQVRTSISPQMHGAPLTSSLAGRAMLVSLVFFQPISRIAPFASLVFLGVQGRGRCERRRVGRRAARAVGEPPAAIYQFSPTRNVIHVVLDEFQADVFNDIFQQDRAALDRQFAGFQYFADHAGSFPTTSFSMPAMLAGQEYRNQKPAPEFIREAFKQSSVFERCRRLDTTSTRCRSCRPIRSSNGWVRRRRRTGKARGSGYGNRSSAAKTTARSPRVSCLNCRFSATCHTLRRPSASNVPIRSIGPSQWTGPSRRRRSAGTRPATRRRFSNNSSAP